LLLLLLIGVTLSLTYGQDRPSSPSSPSMPPVQVAPNPVGPAAAVAAKPPLDEAHLTKPELPLFQGARRGADWLARLTGDDGRFDGRFLYGWLPALNCKMDGDHYLRQVGAAFALARAARCTGQEKYDAYATHALLSLLDETLTDKNDPQVRCTVLPSIVINRLGAAGLLVLAINELPAPQADLLEKSEQLCNFIRKQARPDGSLCCADLGPDGKPAGEEADAVNQYPGAALYALMRSYKRKPQPWKLDVVRKAVAYYRPWWQAHKNMAFVPWQSAAYTEAYLLTGEKAFAECVFEMNDWMCELQNVVGGFRSWTDGQAVETVPQVDCAAYAEGLVEACRVARATTDVKRHERYTEAVERCLQFLLTLQYNDINTSHFAVWYREKRLVGGFHLSHQDGNLRIDYTQHAVSALFQYLEHVAH
jgi:hypothetical protein